MTSSSTLRTKNTGLSSKRLFSSSTQLKSLMMITSRIRWTSSFRVPMKCNQTSMKLRTLRLLEHMMMTLGSNPPIRIEIPIKIRVIPTKVLLRMSKFIDTHLTLNHVLVKMTTSFNLQLDIIKRQRRETQVQLMTMKMKSKRSLTECTKALIKIRTTKQTFNSSNSQIPTTPFRKYT